MIWFLVFIIPILSMGLISQEWSSGTMETLMTAPVGEADVVVGKFLGSLGPAGRPADADACLRDHARRCTAIPISGRSSADISASCWSERCSSRSGCSAPR